jgi:hypothetical protein
MRPRKWVEDAKSQAGDLQCSNVPVAHEYRQAYSYVERDARMDNHQAASNQENFLDITAGSTT